VVTQEVAKVAKGAMKYMNKAMNMAVAGTHTSHHRDHGGYEDDNDGMDEDFGQRTAVICFKVLDLNKVRRDCAGSGGGGRVKRPAAVTAAAPRRVTSTATTTTSSVSQHSSSAGLQRPHSKAPVSAGAPRIPPHNQPAARPSAPTGNLMDFGSPHLSHANSMPSVSSTTVATSATGKIHPDETRAEKLQREYAEKNANSNRVWDEVDERWVDGPVKNGEVISTTAASSNSFAATEVTTVTTSIQGISLCTSNAIGKSAQVQAAVHARVSEMQSSQQKAISELRSRETAKASADAEEEIVRQRLEPRLKAWSEEHGKKKQLRALLANLHTILWEGSGWKQVSLADVLDEAKVKRVYHKASRVVHPDKTGHLDAEKRFVSKRVFDALTQAKVEFDEGK
jgi:ribosomal protein S13